MTEIKIEHKRSSNWLWLVLGLVALALLAWWLLTRSDGRDTVAAGGDIATVPAVADGAITDLGALTAAAAADLAGRRVALGDAPVQEVVSDKGFWIGDATNRAFVVRGNEASPATPPDGAVNAGQRVAVWGVVERMPADLTQQSTAWNLRSTDASALAGRAVYVQADSVRILSR